MTNRIQEARRLRQSIWLDFISRGLIASGQLKKLVEEGVCGMTSNPTIFHKAITSGADYDEAIRDILNSDPDIDTRTLYDRLVVKDIRLATDVLRPLYEQADGADGLVSLEPPAQLSYDTEGTIAEARRLWQLVDRPNVMIKISATPEGIPAVEKLIAEGLNINVTLMFSLKHYEDVAQAYIRGIRRSSNPQGVASVASFFVSRVDTYVDRELEKIGTEEALALRGKVAIANSKLVYRRFSRLFHGEEFAAQRQRGARVQRVLWGSTGTKNPAYSDVLYVDELIGPDTVNTLPLETLEAFLDHGRVRRTLDEGLEEAEEVLSSLKGLGVNLDDITEQLQRDGVKAFADSFDKLLAGIEEKKRRLLTKEHIHPGVDIGEYISDVEAALEELSRREVVKRIWGKDHTVWKDDPAEITDRLGWLTVIDQMQEMVPSLQLFAKEVREAGFQNVLLLGMGGSSLGPEVLSQTLGSAPGFPKLTVLEAGSCIVPVRIGEVTDAIEPLDTLLILSSKSGTTIEPLSIFDFFRNLVESALSKDKVGENFVAITDPGSPLAVLAEKAGFGNLFLNPPDIGGRYSVLSGFGMVPAAAIGADIAALLDRADCMKESTLSCVPVHDNDAAWLGACIGAMALKGRDKLTLITSSAVASFGIWVEQLLAESTGKEGKGIIPIVGEPLLDSSCYGSDRLFIYLRLKEDDNSDADKAVEKLKSSGQPVITLEMRDKYDLGGEFFRWEFATAVAGAVLGIHPFNQPDVQSAKDATQRILQEYLSSGQHPQMETTGSIKELLAEAQEGRYLSIMAYVCQSSERDQAFGELRRKVMERYCIATTLGYGPRFLHSTGQLHKGGPKTGLFLQITAGHEEDILIPGKPYTFGVVADAQAMGDFQALQSRGQRVIRVHFSRCSVGDISGLINELT
ncbi:MAG: bifunctional transaldolase/phosoglucose isomerase [Chloroflexi bacterium]|nr:bifunctional transaldolase/phosoglucose isomerase [Chloroflexota bacterium]MBI3931725.1 bifunctional transaldolase/phosoglucose isomerase [Chloroflexota bacterium]